MNKLIFDGILKEKNLRKKIRDLSYELDFSGNEQEEDFYYHLPKKVYPHKRKFFIHK